MANDPQSILVLNSGSSSLKFGLYIPGFGDEKLLLHGSAEGIGRESGSLQIRDADGATVVEQTHVLESQPEALQKIAAALEGRHDSTLAGVGHRMVHGGPQLREHTRITPEVMATLKASAHFAPLHIPLAIQLVEQAQHAFAAPQFACFDNAFHRTMPEVACHLSLPERFFKQGVMRYGFHGLSCESVVHQLGADVPARLVIAHLGNGASVTAVRDGRSVDTSMGLTPTGGITMGTRTGDLDPGVLLYLMRAEKLDADALEALVNHDCGLAGLSGGESDMQALLQRSDPTALLAVDAFCMGVRKSVGSFAGVLNGIDLLVFTGGIGEHSQLVRERVCEGLGFLGLSPTSGVRVVPSQEEVQIARHTRMLIEGQTRRSMMSGDSA